MKPEKKPKILVVYHNDPDGICSAAITNIACKNIPDLKFLPFDYGEDFSFGPPIYDYLYILDCSFDPEVIQEQIKLIGDDRIIWIDHHKTAIDNLKNFSYLKGIRDISRAACILTWKYFYKEEIPFLVRLIEDRDLWNFKFGDETRYAYEWLVDKNMDPTNSLWQHLFNSEDLGMLYNEGKKLYDKKMQTIRLILESDSAFEGEIIVKGKRLKCLIIDTCIGKTATSDIASLAIQKGYPVSIVRCVERNKLGRIVRYNSIRSRSSIDVSEYAKSRGGGGHKNSAGWTD